jgi:hypothetical protein
VRGLLVKSGVVGNWGYAWHCANYRKPKFLKRVFRACLMYVGILP